MFTINEEQDGTFMISPQSAANNGTYLIQVQTREEAENIRSRLGRGELLSPLESEYLRMLGISLILQFIR